MKRFVISLILIVISAFVFSMWAGAEEQTAESEQETAVEAEEETEAEAPDVNEDDTGMSYHGDVNSDGLLTADDARSILRCSVGLQSFNPEIMPFVDADADGDISSSDARLVLRASVGLESVMKHSITVSVDSADCKNKGKVVYACGDCDFSGEYELPLVAHQLVTIINIKATCTSDGYIYKMCKVCKGTLTERPEKLGHNWKKTSAVKATACTRCNAEKTGWEKYDGKYYYFYTENKRSVLAVNTIVENRYYVDYTGVRATDDVITLALDFVNKHSSPEDTNEKRLKDCYEYLYKNFSYKTMYGTPTVSEMDDCAAYMLKNGNGNCYRYAATFAYIARVLGYDSRVVMGKVRGVYGDMVAHSFTEVFVDGKWRICDPSQNTAYKDKNWYLCTENDYPKEFQRGTVASLTVKNGKVIWS